MMLISLVAWLPLALAAAKRDFAPALPYDANTSKYCTWWFDNNGTHVLPCSLVPRHNGCTLQDFLRWVRRFLTLPPCTAILLCRSDFRQLTPCLSFV